MSQSSWNVNEIFERITDAFVALDTNWRYTYMNKRASEIFNRDPKEVIGKHIWTEFPEGRGQPFHKAYEKAMTDQQYVYMQEYYPPYDKWFENHIYPSSEGLSIFFRDITEQKKAEEVLRANEKQLDLIYNTVNDIIFLISIEKEQRFWFKSVNRSFLLVTGLKQEQIIGKYIDEVIPEPSLTLVLNNYNRAIQTHETVEWEEISEYPAGRKTGIVTVTPVFNDMDECTTLVGTVHDITGHKKAEEVLNQNKIFIESIINSSPDIVYIFDIEKQKNVYVNDGIQRNLDYTDEEIKEMGDQMLSILMHPDDLEYYLQNTFPKYSILKDKEIIVHEFRMKDKAGEWHWLHCKESIFLRNPDGKPKQIFGVVADITERKKMDDEILKEKYLSESILNSLPGVFYLYDKNGKFLRWNKNLETVSGYSSEEIREMHPLDFFDEEEKELLSKKIENVFISGEDNVVANFLHKTKEKIPYYFTGITVDYEGKQCLMGVGIDFSERIQAQEIIKETTDQLRQLTAHLQNVREEERKRIGREIHDELGQQLTAIKMDIAWIDKKTPDETSAIKSKLKNIIGLLDVSNRSVRKILSELRPGILDNQGLLDALAWQGRQFTETTGIPVVFTTTENKIKLSPETATCIFRVYQESLTNIMRHAKAGKVLTSLTITDGNIVLTIEDDGIGFDVLSIQNKGSFGILGMKERVLSLNGKFKLESANGKGTRIIISLPFRA